MRASPPVAPGRGVSLATVAAAMIALEALVVWLFAGVWFPGLV